MVSTRGGLVVSGRLRDIFCQASGSVPSRSWSISEISQWMPSDMTRPSPTIRLHCPSVLPPHKAFSPSKARHVWQPGFASRLSTKQTRYIIFTWWRSILLTHHHQAIALDPSSPRGYNMMYEALHKAGDFDNAVDALETKIGRAHV